MLAFGVFTRKLGGGGGGILKGTCIKVAQRRQADDTMPQKIMIPPLGSVGVSDVAGGGGVHGQPR